MKEEQGLIESIFRYFDIPCWPEMTGMGGSEELVGFWLPLYQRWEVNQDSQLIEEAIASRPGMLAAEKFLKGKQTFLLKGQMIGPVTLLLALKREKALVIDREKIFEFIFQSFVCQGVYLGRFAKKIIISLDEPCAFMDVNSARIWADFFARFSFQEQFGIALHSCGELNLEMLNFPWHVIHVDLQELRDAIDREPAWLPALEAFAERGSWLAIGAVQSSLLGSLVVEKDHLGGLCEQVFEVIKPGKLHRILFSTSCGIGAMSLETTKSKLAELEELSKTLIALSREG